VLEEVGVGEIWLRSAVETEGDLGDDVAVAVGGVEEAGAVGEAALFLRQGEERKGFEVEGADFGDGGGDLLAVGSDVLDGRAADEAGDSGEAFDAGDAEHAGGADEVVPGDAGVDLDLRAVETGGGADGGEEDEAGKALVGNDEVGAAADGEDGQTPLAGEVDGFEEFGFGGDAGEVAGGASDVEGGEGGEGDVFFYLHD
jgi:hypothetical protein